MCKHNTAIESSKNFFISTMGGWVATKGLSCSLVQRLLLLVHGVLVVLI